MHILICFALKDEAAPFRKIAAGKSGISILLTGIGRQNAEKSLREFLLSWGARASGTHRQASRLPENARIETIHAAPETGALPELVLTCGFAGGLNPDLKLGAVVFERSTLNSQLSTRLPAAGAKPAKFVCADRIATTVAEKKALRDKTGADAVEMESAAIHAVCAEKHIPCATVRVISDTASEDLPLDFNALVKPDKNLDFGKLFLAIAKSPRKIGALMNLQKKTRFAAERLAEVLIKVL
ncbi:MAG: hypothetical protein WAO21_07850 [Verrucomicrobiia bacterium]|jgi:adenosylhomocysteine nucleosidase